MSPQRRADCSACHLKRLLEHSTNQTFGGKKCQPTKGQNWLPLGQRGLGGTLPPAGETGIVTREGGRELGVWLWPYHEGGKQ